MTKDYFVKRDVLRELAMEIHEKGLWDEVEKDYLASDDYGQYWITKKERKALSADVFVEKKNGKLTIYKDLKKDGVNAYVTRVEMSNKPKNKKNAETLLSVIDLFMFQTVKFEGKKLIGIKSKYGWRDVRMALMTKVFQKIMSENYGDSAYVVTNSSGLFILFSIKEDPFAVANDIASEAIVRENGFEVLLVQKNKLTNIIKFSPIKQQIHITVDQKICFMENCIWSLGG